MERVRHTAAAVSVPIKSPLKQRHTESVCSLRRQLEWNESTLATCKDHITVILEDGLHRGRHLIAEIYCV